jgi:hypothetical protein
MTMKKKTRMVLVGHPYNEPRYYGTLEWNDRNVYLYHPGGGKDSRHKDGQTFLKSTGEMRSNEIRLETSDVSRELVNYVDLPSSFPEPPVLRGEIRKNDFVLHTTEAGALPRLAVEIVENARLDEVLNAWKMNSTAPNVQAYADKGLGQSLVIAVAGSLITPPSA